MKLILPTLIFFILFTSNIKVQAEEDLFFSCPLCNKEGGIICPAGYKAACADEVPGDTKPKCIFYENKYIPGCWKFIGIKKLNVDFLLPNMPPSAMIEIIGGGETYTLNRDIVGCKKL